MASILITEITLSCVPLAQFNTTIEYRVSGPGAYTNAGTALTNTDGTFVTPFVINGLTDNTCYDIRFTVTTSNPSICPFVDGFCFGSGTTTTTTTTSTTTTTTSTTTTTTTTLSFCMSEGYPAGSVYGALYWADSYTDTSTSDNCAGNPVFLPSESRAVWIVFFSNTSLTTPIITSLNSYPIVVNGSPVNIGDGTPQIAYFVGVYPYSGTQFTGFGCETEGFVNDLPPLDAATCFSLPSVTEVPQPASGTIQRGTGDTPGLGFSFDFRGSIIEAGQSSGGTLSSSVCDVCTGPTSNTNLPVYGNITIDPDTFWGVSGTSTVTIQGMANDGTTGETISGIPAFTSSPVTSSKRYYADANHSITITVDQPA